MLVEPTRTEFPERDVVKRCMDCGNVTTDQADRCYLCSSRKSRENAERVMQNPPMYEKGYRGMPIHKKCTHNPHRTRYD